MLELRILDGTHAGARVLLSGQAQSLGSSLDCDLILSDEGVHPAHARLEPQEDGSVLLQWLDADRPALTLHGGEATCIGPVHIALEPATAPWRTDVPLLQPAPGPEDLREPTLDPLEPGDETLAVEARETPQRQAPGVLPTPRRLRVAAIALAGLLAVGVASFAWWTTHRPAALPTAARVAPPPVDGKPAESVQAVVGRLGFANRVRIEQAADGTTVVHAKFLSEDDVETLAAGLARLSPRPGLKLSSEEDLQAAVNDAVQRLTPAATVPITVRYLGGARFQLDGRLADDAQRDGLLSALAKEFPEVLGFESNVRTDKEIGSAMVDDLVRLGVGDITGEWAEGKLVIDARLAARQVPRWEAGLVAAAARHDIPFQARLTVFAEKAAEAAPQLPFKVRSVVGGELGYVVLADGQRLVAGGRISGWRVVDIRPQSVLFEDGQGRRLTLER